MNKKNPYPGLRPFLSDESDIFFGREEHCDQLIDKLADSRFLAVVGLSGCGKSSLVRAGLIPELNAGYMGNNDSDWLVAEMRPGGKPIENLSNSLKDVLNIGRSKGIAELQCGLSALLDLLRKPLPKDTNLLLLVDQFEEIFRLSENAEANAEADSFVTLILDAAEQEELPIYVVITMRTDYIGECAQFEGLPEVMNNSLFITPRLTQEQLHDAIVGPARVFGGKVDYLLVKRLLNDVGTNPDYLPLMQHVLMRSYTHAINDNKTEKQLTCKFTLTQKAYEEVGGIEKALSDHADEAYAEIKKKGKEYELIAEILFKCLSLRDEGQREIRNPMKLSKVANICIKDPEKKEKEKNAQLEKMIEQVKEVVAVFSRPEYSFIVQSGGSEVILDISHESLIRQWRKICGDKSEGGQEGGWIEEEASNARTYLRLEDRARQFKKGEAYYIKMPELKIFMDWKGAETPNNDWAERYIKVKDEEKDKKKYFNQTMDFLAKSKWENKKKNIYTVVLPAVVAFFILLWLGKEYIYLPTTADYFVTKKIFDENEISKKVTLFGNNLLNKNKGEHPNQDDLDNARVLFNAANEISKNINAYIGLGNALELEGNYFRAINNYNKAIDLEPNNVNTNTDLVNAYIGLGSVYLRQNNFEFAIENYKKAIDLEPNNVNTNTDLVNAYIGLGSVYLRQNNFEFAIENYKKAIDLEPNNANAYIGLGRVYSNQERFKESIKNYEKAIKNDDKNVNAYNGLGSVYSRRHQFKESIENYEKAIKNDGKNVNAYIGLGSVYSRLHQFKESIENYEKAIKNDDKNVNAYNGIKIGSRNVNAYNGLGSVHLRQNNVPEAKKNYEEAVKIDPRNANAYIGLGSVYSNQKRFKEAIENYEKAIEFDPRSAKAYRGLGSAHLSENNVPDAKKNYEKAIEIDPINSNAYVGLGSVYSSQKKFVEAIKNYKKAIELDPRSANAYRGLGSVRLRQNKFADAEKNYEEVIEIDPRNASAYYKNGYALLMQKKYNQAIKCCDIAIQLDPGNSDKYNVNKDYALSILEKDNNELKDKLESYEEEIK